MRSAYVASKNVDELEVLIDHAIGSARNSSDANRLPHELVMGASQLLKVEAYEKSAQLLDEFLELAKIQSSKNWTYFYVKSLLGEVYLNQSKLKRAKLFLAEGYEGMNRQADTIPASVRQTYLTNCLAQLVNLATKLEDEEALKKWKAELESIRTAG